MLRHKQLKCRTLLHLLFFGLVQSLAAQYQPDMNYGQQGKVRLHFDTYNEVIQLLHVGGDTSLALCNTSEVDTASFDEDIVLCRLLPHGQIDSSFAQKGILRYDFPGMDISEGRQIIKNTSGGYFLLGTGYPFSNTSFHPFWLSRILANGRIDSTFGNNGSAYLQFAGLNETPNCIKIDHQNRLVIAGATTDTTDLHSEVPVLARMDQNGKIDSSFGVNGKVYIRFPYGIIQDRSARHVIGGVLNDFIFLNDDRILAAGGYSNSNNIVCFFVMLHPDGSIDSTFFNDGYIGLDLTAYASNYTMKLALKDNKIFFCAKSDAIVSRDFYYGYIDLATLDYETDAIDFNQDEDVVKDMFMTTDGRLLFAGYSTLPQHNTSSYFSDFFALAGITGQNYPYGSYHQTFAFDSCYQNGINSFAAEADGKLLCGGFVNTATGSDAALLRLIPQFSDIQTPNIAPGDLNIFPNPAHQFVWLKTNSQEFVQLFDVCGKQVEIISPNTNEPIDVSHLPTGIYLLKQGAATKKLLIIH